MSTSKKPSPTFSPEFKSDSVTLAQRIGIPTAAKDLGISDSALRKWVKATEARGEQAFVPPSERTDFEAINRRLLKENAILKQERDILKKATAFFAKENG